MSAERPSADAAPAPVDGGVAAPTWPGVPTTTAPGVVTGRPLTWLRVEAAAVAAAALVLFAATGQPWWLVPALFLVPDLFALGYLASPKVGAWTYNLAHTMPLPLVLLATGSWWHASVLSVAGAVGLLHIGADRAMRYGVKYDHGFAVTHLGVHGGPATSSGARAGEATPPSSS